MLCDVPCARRRLGLLDGCGVVSLEAFDFRFGRGKSPIIPKQFGQCRLRFCDRSYGCSLFRLKQNFYLLQ